MDKQNDEFAFPIVVPTEFSYAADGMTLRDYFAAKALPALIEALFDNHDPTEDELAKAAYKQADAMLRERSKKQEAQ